MILDAFNLHGKTAVVTGCNTGLGQGIAVSLAEAGADIFGVFRTDPGLTPSLVENTGQRFYGFKADLQNTACLELLVKKAVSVFSHIDILVNNAGSIVRDDSISFSVQDWDAVMNLNAKSVFFLSQACAKEFVKQGSGKIINIASMLSFQGGLRVPSYTASKSAVRGLTMSLSNEWASLGINVNAVAPGYMETSNTAALREDKERNSAILERIPALRWGRPEDLGGAVVFLASKASDYVHGITLPVDGGWLGR